MSSTSSSSIAFMRQDNLLFTVFDRKKAVQTNQSCGDVFVIVLLKSLGKTFSSNQQIINSMQLSSDELATYYLH